MRGQAGASDPSRRPRWVTLVAAVALCVPAAPGARGQAPTSREWRLSDAHTSTLTALAYSPDGCTLASASHDQTAKLWDLASGRLLATLRGHAGPVTAVAFAPDGKLLATGGDGLDRDLAGGPPERSGSWIRIWDVANGRPTRTIGHHWGSIRSVAFSPDGARLAAIDFDAKVRIWDVATGALQTLSGLPNPASRAAISLDLGTVAVSPGGIDHAVIVMETATRKVLATLTGPRSTILSLAFSPDGTRLAAGVAPRGRGRSLPQPPDQPPEVWTWDLRPGAPKEGKVLGRLQESATIVAFSPDGRRLFGGGDREPSPRIWDIATGEERVRLDAQPRNVYAAAFSPDGASLAVGGLPIEIAILDAETGRERAHLAGKSAYSLAFLPGDRTLVAGMSDGTVALWDVEAGRVRTAFPGPGEPLSALAVSPDGKWLAAGGCRRGFYPADLAVWPLDPVGARASSQGYGGRITALAFSPDSKTLAAADDEGTLALLARPLFYERRPPWKAHKERVRALAFSPDGRSLASVGQDGAILVWDAADGRQRMSLPGRISPGGAQGQWSEVVVRDGETAYVIHNGSRDQPIPNFAVAFLPDGKTLVVGYEDSGERAGIAFYDLDTGRRREDRKPPKEDAGIWGELLGIALTPDGKVLAAAGYNSVSLWDVASWTRRTHFKTGGMPPVRAMAVSPDGATLATGTDQVIQLWSLPDILEKAPAR